jgi:hypothetical protein
LISKYSVKNDQKNQKRQMMTKKPLNRLLRTAAILMLLAGAILSAILTLQAGRKNASIILPALF